MKPLLASVNSVLFDLDGTLAETHIDFPLMKREMIALATEAGLDAAAVSTRDILGVVAAATEVLREQNRNEEAERLYARAMKVLRDIEMQHASETEVVPFAPELLRELRSRRIPVGIVTRNCREASEHSLAVCNISPDVLICREDSNNHKPHPEPILLALAKLNAAAGNSIMVGDHIMDVQGGKAAGLKTIGFLREDRPKDFFDAVSPDYVARSLEEVLIAIIGCDR